MHIIIIILASWFILSAIGVLSLCAISAGNCLLPAVETDLALSEGTSEVAAVAREIIGKNAIALLR